MSNKKAKKYTAKPEDYVSTKEAAIYGAADIFGGGQAAFLSVILLAFFTNIIGIEAAVASTIITVSKLWDAISDTGMGLISDNTRWSKLGRRKPYMIIGGILIPFGLAFLFAPIQGFGATSKIVWMVFAYIVYCTISTISQVPFMSMASDISMDYRERNKANTWKLIFDIISSGLLYLIPNLLWGQVSAGNMSYNQFYYVIVFGFGLFFGLPLVVAGFMVKERAPFDRTVKTSFSWKTYFKGLTVKSYTWHIVMYVSAFLTMDIVSALAIYYTDYIGDHSGLIMGQGAVLFEIGGKPINMGSMWVIMPMMIFAAVGIIIAFVLKAKFSKQVAFRTLLPLYIIGAILLACYDPRWGKPWLIPIFSGIMGIGFAGAQSMPWLIFPDTVDVAELKLGYRPTANMSGVMTFARKAATAFGVGMVGWVLTGAGYVPSKIVSEIGKPTTETFFAQPDSVYIAIRVLLAVSVGVLITTGFIAACKYKVTDKKLERIRFFIDKRNEVGVEGFSAEEKEEYDKLVKELC